MHADGAFLQRMLDEQFVRHKLRRDVWELFESLKGVPTEPGYQKQPKNHDEFWGFKGV